MRSAALFLLVAVLVPAATARADFVQEGSPIPVLGQPRGLETADFNRDGLPDLAVAGFADGKVGVLLRQPGGGFVADNGSPFTAAVGTNQLAVADFSGDLRADIATANFVSPSAGSTWRVLLRGDAGGFAPDGAAAALPAAYSIAAGDFNGDARPDLVVGSDFNDSVFVFMHNAGPSGFAPAENGEIGMSGHKKGLTTGDFDGDGRIDIATADDTAGTVSVLLRKPANNGFTILPAMLSGARPQRILAGDFNGDARPDLAVSNNGADSVSLLLAQTGGTFAPAPGSPYGVGDGPLGLARADFNLDGLPDLAVANNGSGSISLLLGAGGGGLTPQPVIPAGASGANGLVAADFDADGRPDLAVANTASSSVTVLRNAPPPAPPPPPVNLDVDGDNSLRPADCNDANPTVFPGAVDTPGDGIDQDCIGGDASYPRLRRTVAYGIKYGTAFSVFTSLSVKPGRAGDHIRLRCKGRGCRIGTKVLDVAKNTARISLTKHVRGARMRPGASLEVRITRPGTVGKSVKYTVRSGRKPRKRERCLPPGSTMPVKCSA